ncbi:MAG: hypothetical protein CMJ59_19740, partial [Planctomycetaceae bacterium]|nr:hypothetical protein [Planctomycetaceae bacterium]
TATTEFSEASQARLDELIQQVQGIQQGLASIGSALSTGIQEITSSVDELPASLPEPPPESTAPPTADPDPSE